MGFVATPDSGHEAVSLGVLALARLANRGGMDADGKSGDGAGLLIQVPRSLVGRVGVAALFEWDAGGRELVAEALTEVGLELAEWRKVPIDPEALGDFARAEMPRIWHGLVAWPDLPERDFEALLFVARRRAEALAEEREVH